MKTIDVTKCEGLAVELLRIMQKDERFNLLPNYEFEAVLAFTISLRSFTGAKLFQLKASDN